MKQLLFVFLAVPLFAQQLPNLKKISASVLGFGTQCSTTKSCKIGKGLVTVNQTTAATITLSGSLGSGTLRGYYTVDGLQVINSSATPTTTCNGGCTVLSSSSSFPSNVLRAFAVTYTNNVFASITDTMYLIAPVYSQGVTAGTSGTVSATQNETTGNTELDVIGKVLTWMYVGDGAGCTSGCVGYSGPGGGWNYAASSPPVLDNAGVFVGINFGDSTTGDLYTYVNIPGDAIVSAGFKWSFGGFGTVGVPGNLVMQLKAVCLPLNTNSTSTSYGSDSAITMAVTGTQASFSGQANITPGGTCPTDGTPFRMKVSLTRGTGTASSVGAKMQRVMLGYYTPVVAQ